MRRSQRTEFPKHRQPLCKCANTLSLLSALTFPVSHTGRHVGRRGACPHKTGKLLPVRAYLRSLLLTWTPLQLLAPHHSTTHHGTAHHNNTSNYDASFHTSWCHLTSVYYTAADTLAAGRNHTATDHIRSRCANAAAYHAHDTTHHIHASRHNTAPSYHRPTGTANKLPTTSAAWRGMRGKCLGGQRIRRSDQFHDLVSDRSHRCTEQLLSGRL